MGTRGWSYAARPTTIWRSVTFRVGLLGHGTVGAAFHELLDQRADAIEAATGLRPEISGVLTRSRGEFDDILERSDLVVELIGGLEPARDYILRAMRAGKHVVTANKQVLSQHGEELYDAAREAGVQLRFEAAVGGVVPMIRVIHETLAAAHIERVHGIVNGTTNFILSEMARTGASYADALREAQELGFAEADPTEDVTGKDAAAKMAIIARLAFGAVVHLDDVPYEGIDNLTSDDIAYAKELGLSLKLIGAAERDPGDRGDLRGVGLSLGRYRDRLPVDPLVTLGEGDTPLIQSTWLSERTGCDVWLKFEGSNPTGSFKDRGMTVAVSAAIGEEAEAVICASTGNTAASAAAYAAKAGLRGAVIVPEGKIAAGKLAQALMHGARVIALRGNFDEALALVRELAGRQPIALVNSVNEYRLEGQKTGAFEVCDELGEPPDVLCIPVGNAGNITAWWRGFTEYEVAPRLHGYQAEGAAPLVHGAPVENPETVASAIRIGNPARWEDAMDAVTASRGEVRAVSDAEILAAYEFLGSREGVFCEPASAASVAGLLKYGAEGRVVCVLTGHGLKDPTTAMTRAGSVIPCEPEIGAVEQAVFGGSA